MPLNRGTRHDPRYCGYVKYRGRKKWVGTHDSLDAFNKAKERCRAELREEVDNPSRRRGVPTVGEFAGARIHDDGRITMTWPDGERAQKATGRRGSTVRHMRDGLTPFVREFHDRPLDDFPARRSADVDAGGGTRACSPPSRQFFNHAVDRDLIERNRFTHLGASKRKRRVDRPDFQLITDEQYERLRRCARESRANDYGLILEGATMAVGETAMRPGEIFGLHCPEVHMDTGMIHVRRQLDLATGEITWPKDDDGRWVPMSPALHAHFEAMPQMGRSYTLSLAKSFSLRYVAATCAEANGHRCGTRSGPLPGCPASTTTS